MSDGGGGEMKANYLNSRRAQVAEAELAALRQQNRALREALVEIMIGKTQADNDHPLGAGWAMAGRFISIARAALAVVREEP